MVSHKATEGPKNLYEHFSSVFTEETSEDMPVMSESKYPDMHIFKVDQQEADASSESNEEGNGQKSIQPNTIPDPGHHMGK